MRDLQGRASDPRKPRKHEYREPPEGFASGDTTSNAFGVYMMVGVGNFMPPKQDLLFSGQEEFVNEHIVSEFIVKKPIVKTSKVKSKTVRKNNGAPIIEDWMSE
ncbi:hypothetical protein Tco_1313188 [Tanacetum coccineum]